MRRHSNVVPDSDDEESCQVRSPPRGSNQRKNLVNSLRPLVNSQRSGQLPNGDQDDVWVTGAPDITQCCTLWWQETDRGGKHKNGRILTYADVCGFPPQERTYSDVCWCMRISMISSSSWSEQVRSGLPHPCWLGATLQLQPFSDLGKGRGGHD